jgi:transcriptional regulator with XRE-family HTH domain
MRNKLKETRLKRKVTVKDLCTAITFKDEVYSEERIIAIENGGDDPNDLDIFFKAAGFLRIPFHEMLYIPSKSYTPNARNFDETWHASVFQFVLEGWFENYDEMPDLKQIGTWADKVFENSIRLHLNFTETRDYANAFSDPDFDPDAIKTMENYLNLKD